MWRIIAFMSSLADSFLVALVIVLSVSLWWSVFQVGKMEKVVLICVGETTRPVTFSTSTTSIDAESLVKAVRITFSDILVPDQKFFLQKCEEWGGRFIDLVGKEDIPDRAVVRAVLRTEVEYIFSLFILYMCGSCKLIKCV